MNVFFNSEHDLRWGWKFILYIVIYFAVLVCTGLTLSIVFVIARLPDTDLTLLAENVVLLASAGVISMFFMVRFVEHLPIQVFGIAFHEYWKRDLRLGLTIAAGMLGVMVAGSAFFGQLTIRWTALETSVPSLLLTLLLLMIAAANEELVFRGYPMQLMMRGLGVWPAVLVMSVLFGLLHMNNPSATPLGTANTILAGIMLAIAYLKTRSLWLPYGIHVGWNVGLGMILGYPLSGIDIGSLWTSQTNGADFIVGGQYGPEGGLLATVIFGGTALYLFKLRRVQVSPTMQTLLEMASNEGHGDASASTSDELTDDGLNAADSK